MTLALVALSRVWPEKRTPEAMKKCCCWSDEEEEAEAAAEAEGGALGKNSKKKKMRDCGKSRIVLQLVTTMSRVRGFGFDLTRWRPRRRRCGRCRWRPLRPRREPWRSCWGPDCLLAAEAAASLRRRSK